ncbi:MAG: ATP synthase F1 subunit gamma [Actinobacteria bacterium]|nr:MAG: ATP synthase F1 subunit gamma [Actinomycetota bacterium]
MAKGRDIKRRIRSVANTQQITRTMEMVATAKIRKAQERIEAARPYALAMMDVLSKVAANVEAGQHPLLQVHEEPRQAVVLLLTSDRGLAGAFNTNVIRLAAETGADEEAAGLSVHYIVVGKKGISHFRYVGKELLGEQTGVSDEPRFATAKDLANQLIEGYTSGEMDRIWLVFNRFKSVVEQKPTRHQLLPIEEVELPEEREPAATAEYLFEPDPASVLSRLLPTYIETLVYRAMMESAASEHGARRTAMKAASDNAGKMIEALTRSYNRARQAQITQEISEIVGGAEALRE